MTLHDTIATARARLVAAGIRADEARVDVDLYVTTILGWDRVRLLTELQSPTPPALDPRFSEWMARRERREPSAYIVGVREFFGLDFVVSPDVLIPRSESELIVEEALSRLADADAPLIADVGTGSGCIGISLAHNLPRATFMATDISAVALVVARKNAARLNVDDRITFVETSYLDGVVGPFDAIVSNPPYVKDADRQAVSRAVIRYEPHVALFGGADGLGGVRALLEAAHTRLVPGGWVIFEFGLGQDDEVREIAEGFPGYHVEDIRNDLQGVPRTAIVRRSHVIPAAR